MSAREYGQQALQIAQEISDLPTEGYALTHLGHALTSLGRYKEAAIVYTQAIDLRKASEPHLVVESQAGLARVLLAQSELSQASALVEEMMQALKADKTQGTEEPFRIYLTYYRVLQANADPRAVGFLQIMHMMLQKTAMKISDESMRHAFLEDVFVHRKIVQEFASREEISQAS